MRPTRRAGRAIRTIGGLARGLVESRILILLYHRVTEIGLDSWSMAVAPRRFADHLDVLRRYAEPISLGRLFRDQGSRRARRRGIVVTFDDGYADNLHEAKPLLERYDVPATVFVTSGMVDADREFWWDELERIVLATTALPAELTLGISGANRTWTIDATAPVTPDEIGRPAATGVVSRRALHDELWSAMRRLDAGERRAVLDTIAAWAGAPRGVRPSHRTLSTAELNALADGPLVEIGAHTVTHPSLAAMPREVQRLEVHQSKERLESVTNRAVTSFAYPFGRERDFTTDTVSFVREAGYTLACANVPGLVSTDAFRLPRVAVGDWDAGRFDRFLWRWLKVGAA